jgi:hypothetical protein
MYDRSGGGVRLRTYAGCSLAWWHSYKWATKRILIVYASDFIAPLFHYLFPTRQFDSNKCSHTVATTILSYIRLAYPRFKTPLREQLANPTISVRQRTILQNLQHLCEFFIPVVCALDVCIWRSCTTYCRVVCLPFLANLHLLFHYTQVQDYYISMRFNDLSFSVQMLYRLFVASSMLRQMKIKGKGTAHNYPKMQLTQLLIIEYWRKTGYYACDLMAANTSIVNEELGEATFSLLGRAVLGDSCRSDFQYMRGVYKLIPIYREVKDDLSEQQGKKNTINWHHCIDDDDEAVASTSVFFNRLIRGVRGNWYRSYNGLPECFMSHAKAQDNLTTEYLGLVYQPQLVQNTLQDVLVNIKRTLHCTFLSDHHDIWPLQEVDGSSEDEDCPFEGDADCTVTDDDQVWGAPWRECKEGIYAVSRSEFPSKQLGISLYLVVSVDVDGKEEDEEYRSFQGRQLTCSIDNCTPECVRDGTWKMHRSTGLTQTETVFDWEVISYFSHLNRDNHIPHDICARIEEHGTRERLFGPV